MTGLFIVLLSVLLMLIDRANQNRYQLDLRSSMEASAAAIEHRVAANLAFLQSLAEADESSPQRMRAPVQRFLADHPELDLIFHATADGRVDWVLPAGSQDDLPGQRISFVLPNSARRLLDANRPGHTDVFETINGDSGFASVAPIAGGGHLVCLYAAERLLRRTVPRQTLIDHQTSLVDTDNLVVASLATGERINRDLQATHRLSAPGNGLTLKLTQYHRPFWTWGTLSLLAMCVSLVAGMGWGMWSLKRQVNRRMLAEKRLRKTHDELEQRVAARTADLETANTQLQLEMTERQRAEERARDHHGQLAYASRVGTMGEMAAGLAHELNQPLGSIASYADGAMQLFKQGKDTNDPLIREALGEISGQARHAGRIIHRLREFVAQESPTRSIVSIKQLIDEVAALMSAELRHNEAKLVIQVPRRLPSLLVDKIQVQQVLVNLMRNAIESMNEVENRTITVAAGIAGERRAVVSVSDTGAGCDDATLTRLFDPFFTTRDGGMGMGLSICRSIIEAHEGQLTATRNPEGGLTFRFTLPQAEGVGHATGHRSTVPNEVG